MTEPPPNKLTSDDFELAAMIDGENCVGRVFSSRQRPRLAFEDMAWRDGRHTRTWIVDGMRHASFAEAEQALQMPPAISPEEQAMLAELGESWVPGADFIGYGESLAILPGTREARRSELSDSLHKKGLIEWEDGKVRRRPQRV